MHRCETGYGCVFCLRNAIGDPEGKTHGYSACWVKVMLCMRISQAHRKLHVVAHVCNVSVLVVRLEAEAGESLEAHVS